MKLYPNLIRPVVDALEEIFQGKKFADKIIQQTLKKDKRWGSRDRGFIAETTYDIVRWYRLLYEIRGAQPNSKADWWEIVGIWFTINEVKLPDWKEFAKLDTSIILQQHTKLSDKRIIKESIPDWLDELGVAELGIKWPPTLAALNQQAPLVIRTNTIKTDRDKLQEILADKGIDATPYSKDALVLAKRRNLFTLPEFKQGLFEIQDGSSQEVANYLGVEPGMWVIDACAGAGGKALHIASQMKNKGRVFALDIHEWKLKELRKRATRAGIDIIENRPIVNQKVLKRLTERADRLLLDVPCSGLGVLKRNPDAKWKIDVAFLEKVKRIQKDILQNYPKMLKKGGQMVYATCSILPSENQQQVQDFLATNKEFTLLKEQQILPQDNGFDGFYMALIQKGE